MKIVTMKVVFNGLYYWGKGFDNSEKARLWNDFWDSEGGKGVFWTPFKKDDGIMSTRYLVQTSGSIYLHPMGFDVLYRKLGSSYHYDANGKQVEDLMEVEELKDICNRCAEFCGCSVTYTEPLITEINI